VKRHVRVLWSNDSYLVCDKPAGIVSCDDPRSVESILREQESIPTLEAVHRLDRDTTGCLMFARNHAALQAAVEIFKTHKVTKIYHAVTVGKFPFVHQVIDSPLDNKPALTRVKREAAGAEASFLRLRIETGRTNQIRRHLASVRAPIVGDRVFGLKSAREAKLMNVPRQMLHASTLSLPDPLNPREEIKVHSPLPADFRGALKLFGMGK
jgi:23S rRNA pseudouridine1911/1915/1917 synthase